MGSRIVVMKDGFMQQVDTPQNLYDYPANLFVAGFIGTPQMNIFRVKLEQAQGDGVVRDVRRQLPSRCPKAKVSKRIDRRATSARKSYMGIRPENIHDEPAFMLQTYAGRLHRR